MSLHIGRLSPHARVEDLVRTFQRFGRCHVRLKDGYGFAVYDDRFDAERALRALQGRMVCGENISLDWSNKQPRPFQPAVRSSRHYPRRSFWEKRNDNRYGSFHGRRDLPARKSEKHDTDNLLYNKEAEIIDENHFEAGKNKLVNQSSNNKDCNTVENDRWVSSDVGDQVSSLEKHDEAYDCYKNADEDEKLHRNNSEKFPRVSPPELHEQISCSKDELKEPFSEPIERHSDCVRSSDELNFREKQELRLKRFKSNSWRMHARSFNPDSLQHIRDSKDSLSERNKRASRTSNLSSESRKSELYRNKRTERSASPHGNSNDAKPVPKKAREDSRSRKSKWSSAPSTASPKSIARLSSSKPGSVSPLSRSRSRSRIRSNTQLCSRSISRSSSHSHSHLALPGSNSPMSSVQSGCSRSRSKARSSSSCPRSLSVCLSPHQNPAPLPGNEQQDDRASSPLNECEENAQDTAIMKTEKIMQNDPISNFRPVEALLMEGASANREHLAQVGDPGSKSEFHENTVDEDQQNGVSGNQDHIVGQQQYSSIHSGGGNSINLTGNELFKVLKHYGMEAPSGRSVNLTASECFGAARLWPWEVIFYRRTKKGPISTENYARRVEQNREYGIVDKYVRSSSGWWETK